MRHNPARRPNPNEDAQEVRRRIKDAVTQAGIAGQVASPVPDFTQNSHVVLKRRYLSKDREGNILEDPEGMFRRVARNLSQADLGCGATEAQRQATEEEFYQVMRRLEFHECRASTRVPTTRTKP